ncbi:MAG: hypothetical protein H6531_01850 [Actinobacteria bacterium]|nr:hypothetical protein [Actinomycetota bacterium]
MIRGPGSDLLRGGGGDDVLMGRRGRDRLHRPGRRELVHRWRTATWWCARQATASSASVRGVRPGAGGPGHRALGRRARALGGIRRSARASEVVCCPFRGAAVSGPGQIPWAQGPRYARWVSLSSSGFTPGVCSLTDAISVESDGAAWTPGSSSSCRNRCSTRRAWHRRASITAAGCPRRQVQRAPPPARTPCSHQRAGTPARVARRPYRGRHRPRSACKVDLDVRKCPAFAISIIRITAVTPRG